MLFVVMDLFIAALAACLCGWLIRSARHGTADNDDGHGDDATRLRVFGGACRAALTDVRLGARSRCVRVQILLMGGGCLGVGRSARSLVLVTSASVASTLLRDGWARVGGWVGWCQCSVCRYFVAVGVLEDVCGCRPVGLGM
jgi:hypothetical protein